MPVVAPRRRRPSTGRSANPAVRPQRGVTRGAVAEWVRVRPCSSAIYATSSTCPTTRPLRRCGWPSNCVTSSAPARQGSREPAGSVRCCADDAPATAAARAASVCNTAILRRRSAGSALRAVTRDGSAAGGTRRAHYVGREAVLTLVLRHTAPPVGADAAAPDPDIDRRVNAALSAKTDLLGRSAVRATGSEVTECSQRQCAHPPGDRRLRRGGCDHRIPAAKRQREVIGGGSSRRRWLVLWLPS